MTASAYVQSCVQLFPTIASVIMTAHVIVATNHIRGPGNEGFCVIGVKRSTLQHSPGDLKLKWSF